MKFPPLPEIVIAVTQVRALTMVETPVVLG
jgi:hypothetical protein